MRVQEGLRRSCGVIFPSPEFEWGKESLLLLSVNALGHACEMGYVKDCFGQTLVTCVVSDLTGLHEQLHVSSKRRDEGLSCFEEEEEEEEEEPLQSSKPPNSSSSSPASTSLNSS
jgi:hypothetical protein